jgi:hypothetical protein
VTWGEAFAAGGRVRVKTTKGRKAEKREVIIGIALESRANFVYEVSLGPWFAS